tara:strand:+ start:1037 stop:2908 length:1872 start_codon:yes stop_codon:yes gene_type:complete
MALNLQTLTSPTTSSDVIADIENPADSSDLVVTLKNLATTTGKTTNGTQTVSAAQGTALQGKGLHLPGTTSNYASVPDASSSVSGNFTLQVDNVSLIMPQPTTSMFIAKDNGGNARSFRWGVETNRKLQLVLSSNGSAITYYSSTALFDEGLFEGSIRVIRNGSTITFYTDTGAGFVQFGNVLTDTTGTLASHTFDLGIGGSSSGAFPTLGLLGRTRIWNTATPDTSDPVFDIDFTSNNITAGATSFTAGSGQVVTINQSGDDVARIVKGSHLIMDLVDDEYEFTTDSAVNGTIVVATLEGTYSANISLAASTQYDLQARGVASSANKGFLKNSVGYLISSSVLSASDIARMESYFVDKGAAARSAFKSVTNFSSAWEDCSSLTSFPADINLGTNGLNVNFASAWKSSGLTSFSTPLPTAGSCANAWRSCSSLTDFNLDTLPATSLSSAFNNSGLTSWSTEIPNVTSCSFAWYYSDIASFNISSIPSATSVQYAWLNTPLTSFSTSLPVCQSFKQAWQVCSSLTDFSVDVFTNWNPSSVSSGVFNKAWDRCTSLTAQSVENILTSLDTSGVYGTNTGASGGTQLADNTIEIDYDGTTLSSATATAITNLKSKNWAININNVIQ